MKKVSHISVGRVGEDLAVEFLRNKGLEIVGRNWRCKQGELDLIAWQGSTLVFVEVKSRVDSRLARKHIFDNINQYKQRKLKLLVQIFLARMFPKTPNHRLDIVGVLIDPKTLNDSSTARASEIKHLVAAL